MTSRYFYHTHLPTLPTRRLALSTLSSLSVTNSFLVQVPPLPSPLPPILAHRLRLTQMSKVSSQPAVIYPTQITSQTSQTIESIEIQPSSSSAITAPLPPSTTERQAHKTIERVIRYCMLAMCVLMTASRIHSNYQRYASYPVIISGRVYVSNTEALPQLSVCFQDVIDPHKLMLYSSRLHAEYEQRITEGTEKLMRWISSTFTIRQVLQLSYDYDSYFYNCSLLSQDALKRESCNDSWQVWLTARRKCYSFFRPTPDISGKNDFINKVVVTSDDMVIDGEYKDQNQINSSFLSTFPMIQSMNNLTVLDINKLPENQTLDQIINAIRFKRVDTKEKDDINSNQTEIDFYSSASNETDYVASLDMHQTFRKQNRSVQQPNYDYNRILLTNKIWVNLFIRKYNLRIRRKLDLLLQPPHTLLRVDRSNPGLQSLSTDYTKGVYISYERSTIARLPDPYSTRCVDYQKSGFLDRAHCMYECESSRFMHLYNTWPDGLPISGQRVMSKDLDKGLHFNLTTAEESKIHSGHQGINCEHACEHLDCFHEQLKLLKNYHKLDKYRGHPIMEVRLYLNSAPVTVLEYNPVYPSLNSQVQLFIGPASLWLGLSVFGIGRLIFGFVWKIAEFGQKVTGQRVKKFSVASFPSSKDVHKLSKTNKNVVYTDEFIVLKSRKIFDRIGSIHRSFESIDLNDHLETVKYSPARKRLGKFLETGNQVVQKTRATK